MGFFDCFLRGGPICLRLWGPAMQALQRPNSQQDTVHHAEGPKRGLADGGGWHEKLLHLNVDLLRIILHS